MGSVCNLEHTPSHSSIGLALLTPTDTVLIIYPIGIIDSDAGLNHRIWLSIKINLNLPRLNIVIFRNIEWLAPFSSHPIAALDNHAILQRMLRI